jgi:DNA-binding CsgD family transcriptional regulator
MPLIWFHCTDTFDAARRRYAWEEAWLRARGDDLSIADRSSHLAVAELRSGNWRAAEELSAAAAAVAERTDATGPRAMMLEKRALVDAFRGRTHAARAVLEPLIASYEQAGQRWWAALSLSTLALAERFEGNDEAASSALRRMRSHALSVGVRDVLFDRSEPYHVDALLQAGDPEGARRVLARLELRGRVLPRRWIQATLPAARALVAAADGPGAARQPEPAGAPFEDAWALLVQGRLQRRAKQKLAAAETLREAARRFHDLGTPPWEARARAELERVGLRRRSPGELTTGERRVAELAATGLTNREVAATAFMSEKTVEANLSRAYRKLGIRSRAELGARMATQREPSTET